MGLGQLLLGPLVPEALSGHFGDGCLDSRRDRFPVLLQFVFRCIARLGGKGARLLQLLDDIFERLDFSLDHFSRACERFRSLVGFFGFLLPGCGIYFSPLIAIRNGNLQDINGLLRHAMLVSDPMFFGLSLRLPLCLHVGLLGCLFLCFARHLLC